MIGIIGCAVLTLSLAHFDVEQMEWRMSYVASSTSNEATTHILCPKRAVRYETPARVGTCFGLSKDNPQTGSNASTMQRVSRYTAHLTSRAVTLDLPTQCHDND